MKRNKIIKGLLYSLMVPILMIGCDDEEGVSTSVDFATLATATQESEGSTITIPFRNVGNSASRLGVVFGGEAVEGEDFSLVGITDEGVQIKILDDNLLEDTEQIRVQLTATGLHLTGNNIHEITIASECADEGGLTFAQFAGEFDATEKYGPNPATDWAAPYHVTITQDATNANRFKVANFYGVGAANTAYFIVDISTKSVYFPNQPTAYRGSSGTGAVRSISKSSGTFDYCTHNGLLTLTFQLNYDGGDWEYELVKNEPI